MGNLFSASDIVEVGIQIEKNGRDFYDAVAKAVKDVKAKEVFELLQGEEEKHIKRFEALLSRVKKYEPSEAYPGEYFAYLKTLSEGYIFKKDSNIRSLAEKLKNEKEILDTGIGFEKDSILFYHEMKKFILGDEQNTVDKLIEEEQGHLRKLTDMKKNI
ncbi:MAG: ferritin family protein [Candidatus Omnitrophica bacterium]|nr:ferritin family protein [Candidatus Omnitrophota bacterium]